MAHSSESESTFDVFVAPFSSDPYGLGKSPWSGLARSLPALHGPRSPFKAQQKTSVYLPPQENPASSLSTSKQHLRHRGQVEALVAFRRGNLVLPMGVKRHRAKEWCAIWDMLTMMTV